MATLDDLKVVLESIDRSMTDQKTLLTNMFNAQQTASRLSSVNTSTIAPSASTGQSVGAAVSGIGTGVGVAAAGLGAGGLAALAGMAMFADFDAQAIKDNVVTLLSISDEVGGKVEFLKEGGTFIAAMTGLGLGLAAFGIGQGITGLGQWITDDEWTQTLKSNVIDLLSIADLVGGNLELLKEGGSFFLAMSGLGAGLAAFGVGQALVGIGQWITDTDWAENVKQNVSTLLSIGDLEGMKDFTTINFAGAMTALAAGLSVFAVGNAAAGLAQFVSSENWAEEIKENVATLLSIGDLPGMKDFTTVNFAGAMSLIAAGLTAFALGKGAATVVEGAAEAISFFTGDPFADKIKSEVKTLLSITQLEGIGGDTVGFIATMAGIATGLTAFALGKGAATVVDGAAAALAYFTGDEPFAEKIKSEVETLLSIVGLAPSGSVDEFTNIMEKLSDGLSSFAGGNFVGTLQNAGAAIVSFFFGTQSPFEQIRDIYQNADDLVAGAEALDRLVISLDKISSLKFDGSKLNIKAFAEELAESIPVIESAIMGGTIEKFGLFNDLTFKGLASPDIDYSAAIKNIKNLREALGMQDVEGGGGATTVAGGAGNDRLAESVAAAVAESQIVSPEAERLRAQREMETVSNFQPRMEAVRQSDRIAGAQVNAVDNSVKTDARSSVVGGATVINNFNGNRSSDLDYGLGGLRGIG